MEPWLAAVDRIPAVGETFEAGGAATLRAARR